MSGRSSASAWAVTPPPAETTAVPPIEAFAVAVVRAMPTTITPIEPPALADGGTWPTVFRSPIAIRAPMAPAAPAPPVPAFAPSRAT